MYKTDEVYRFLVKQMKHPKADRSFLNDTYTDIEAWYEETASWVKALTLYDLEPNPGGFMPHVTEEEDFGLYIRKKLYFYTAEDCRVSAYLLVPKDIKAPAPAIVALHDHSGFFYRGKEKIVDHLTPLPEVTEFQEWCYGGRGFASALAQKGYVVAVIDSLGWGERGWMKETWLGGGPLNFIHLKEGSKEYISEYNKAWSDGFARRAADAMLYAGLTYAGVQIWDDIRTVDFLCTLPEVDANRIGCLGLSMGGFRTVMLGALDKRIKCSCPAGYMPLTSDQNPHRLGFALPGLFDSLPFPDVASLMAPRPMMVLNCENDQLFDLSSMEDAANTIKRVYAKAGAAENLSVNWFPVGHMFDREMQECAFAWMEKHL
jgi:dienelactone hydrolase